MLVEQRNAKGLSEGEGKRRRRGKQASSSWKNTERRDKVPHTALGSQDVPAFRKLRARTRVARCTISECFEGWPPAQEIYLFNTVQILVVTGAKLPENTVEQLSFWIRNHLSCRQLLALHAQPTPTQPLLTCSIGTLSGHAALLQDKKRWEREHLQRLELTGREACRE